MRELEIRPDALHSGICEFDYDLGGYYFLDFDELQLPEDFIKEFTVWHEAYRDFIVNGSEYKKQFPSVIKYLDIKGLELSHKLEQLLPDTQVRYFSEGLLKYLKDYK